MDVLKKIREMNHSLFEVKTNEFDFYDLSNLLANIIKSNVLILKDKKTIGFSIQESTHKHYFQDMLENKTLHYDYIKEISKINSTIENIPIEDSLSAYPKKLQSLYREAWTTITPIIGLNERLGTLIVSKTENQFSNNDLILCEHASSIIRSELIRTSIEEFKKEINDKASLQIALGSLSFSEREAIEAVFKELNQKQGILVARSVADKIGITRSVIVSAIRKLESANIIQSRSLGAKGTFIKALNENLLTELKLESKNA